MPLSLWRMLVDQEIKDTAGILSQADKDKAIGEAVKEYSRFRLRERAAQIAGDGASFEFALPSDWEDGFSAIRSVEFPAGQQEPQYLDREDWMFYRDPSLGLRFRLLANIPATNETIILVYVVRHAVDNVVDTVPAADREATAKLAASFCARSLAAYYAQTQDPTLGADAVNYGGKPSQYSGLADTLEKAFKAHLGIKDDEPVGAASVNADLDVDLQSGAGDRFYHSRRWR